MNANISKDLSLSTLSNIFDSPGRARLITHNTVNIIISYIYHKGVVWHHFTLVQPMPRQLKQERVITFFGHYNIFFFLFYFFLYFYLVIQSVSLLFSTYLISFSTDPISIHVYQALHYPFPKLTMLLSKRYLLYYFIQNTDNLRPKCVTDWIPR